MMMCVVTIVGHSSSIAVDDGPHLLVQWQGARGCWISDMLVTLIASAFLLIFEAGTVDYKIVGIVCHYGGMCCQQHHKLHR